MSSRNVKNPLPSFDFRERKPNEESLKDNGHKIGAFVIRNLGADYKKSVDNFYAKAPSCLTRLRRLNRTSLLPSSCKLDKNFALTGHLAQVHMSKKIFLIFLHAGRGNRKGERSLQFMLYL